MKDRHGTYKNHFFLSMFVPILISKMTGQIITDVIISYLNYFNIRKHAGEAEGIS